MVLLALFHFCGSYKTIDGKSLAEKYAFVLYHMYSSATSIPWGTTQANLMCVKLDWPASGRYGFRLCPSCVFVEVFPRRRAPCQECAVGGRCRVYTLLVLRRKLPPFFPALGSCKIKSLLLIVCSVHHLPVDIACQMNRDTICFCANSPARKLQPLAKVAKSIIFAEPFGTKHNAAWDRSDRKVIFGKQTT